MDQIIYKFLELKRLNENDFVYVSLCEDKILFYAYLFNSRVWIGQQNQIKATVKLHFGFLFTQNYD